MVDFTDPTTIGYTLIGLGVLLFLLEATMPGFFVAVPATILVILGVAAFYVDLPKFLAWAPIIVLVVGVPATIVTILVYRKMAPPTHAPTTRSADTLIGHVAVVTVDVVPGAMSGKVRVGREIWSATSVAGTIPQGASARVVKVEGVVLQVEPVA